MHCPKGNEKVILKEKKKKNWCCNNETKKFSGIWFPNYKEKKTFYETISDLLSNYFQANFSSILLYVYQLHPPTFSLGYKWRIFNNRMSKQSQVRTFKKTRAFYVILLFFFNRNLLLLAFRLWVFSLALSITQTWSDYDLLWINGNVQRWKNAPILLHFFFFFWQKKRFLCTRDLYKWMHEMPIDGANDGTRVHDYIQLVYYRKKGKLQTFILRVNIPRDSYGKKNISQISCETKIALFSIYIYIYIYIHI